MIPFTKGAIVQTPSECLSRIGYVLFSGGKAAIFDPLRYSLPYLQAMKANNAVLETVFLTHTFADLVSGHQNLGKHTGARIVIGPHSHVHPRYHSGHDNEDFRVGDINVKMIHTPGHTADSVTYLLQEDGRDIALITGDPLFAVPANQSIACDLNRKDMKQNIEEHFRSVQRLSSVADETLVFPTHGQLGIPGINVESKNATTLKEVREKLKVFGAKTPEEFWKALNIKAPLFPPNAAKIVSLNTSESILDAPEFLVKLLVPLTSQQVKEKLKDPNTIILDARPNPEFIHKNIPNSMWAPPNAKLGTFFASVYRGEKIIIVAEPEQAEKVALRLGEVGIDNVIGFLEGGIDSWDGEVTNSKNIAPKVFAELYSQGGIEAVDVRTGLEWTAKHVVGVQHIPLSSFAKEMETLDKSKEYFLFCGSGVRSTIAQSFARRHGLKTISVLQGFGGLTGTTIKMESGDSPQPAK